MDLVKSSAETALISTQLQLQKPVCLNKPLCLQCPACACTQNGLQNCNKAMSCIRLLQTQLLCATVA